MQKQLGQIMTIRAAYIHLKHMTTFRQSFDFLFELYNFTLMTISFLHENFCQMLLRLNFLLSNLNQILCKQKKLNYWCIFNFILVLILQKTSKDKTKFRSSEIQNTNKSKKIQKSIYTGNFTTRSAAVRAFGRLPKPLQQQLWKSCLLFNYWQYINE